MHEGRYSEISVIGSEIKDEIKMSVIAIEFGWLCSSELELIIIHIDI